MFQQFFGRKRAVSDAVVVATYEAIVAAARQPALYSRFLIADSALGRFESLCGHIVLFLRRTKDAPAPLPGLAQEIVDEFIKDMDHSLRELGIGDAGVPKRMKRLTQMFYGRAQSYGAALDKDDLTELAAALTRNIRPDGEIWPQAAGLAQYFLLAEKALGQVDDVTVASGHVRFDISAEEVASA